MNVIGCCIFIIAGLIAINIVKVQKVDKDYSTCRTAIEKVGHTHDCCGERWTVDFIDDTGNEVLGIDDVLAYSSFSHTYKRPVFGSKEMIYYYPYAGHSRYVISDKVVKYYIHFCDEDLYQLARYKINMSYKCGRILGAFLIICGIMILVFA